GRAVMQAPQHPYADLLAASVPELRPGWLDGIDATRLAEARGAALVADPSRCAFLPRCAARVPGLGDSSPAPLRQLAQGSVIRCHRTEDELMALQTRRASAAILPLKPAVKRPA